MDESQLPAHGAHTLAIEGRVLLVKTWGPWNAQEIQRYVVSFKQCVNDLEGSPWGVLAHIYGEAIHTPESHAAMVEAIRLHQRSGRRATAVLLHVDSAATLVKTLFTRLYADAGEPCEFFSDEAAAREWLLGQIAA